MYSTHEMGKFSGGYASMKITIRIMSNKSVFLLQPYALSPRET